MKSLRESLFDHDLEKSNISVLGVITNILKEFLSGSRKLNEWDEKIHQIKECIGTNVYKINPYKPIKSNELYITTLDGSAGSQLVLVGKNLIDDKTTLIYIRYSYNFNDIYVDVYYLGTDVYKSLIDVLRFQWIRVEKSEIDNFSKNIISKLEKVF